MLANLVTAAALLATSYGIVCAVLLAAPGCRVAVIAGGAALLLLGAVAGAVREGRQ